LKLFPRKPPKRLLQKQLSTSWCRLLAPPQVPERPAQEQVVTGSCRF
jgi:hypothetical protein